MSEPGGIEEASEADVVEQMEDAAGDDRLPTPPEVAPDEANEADVLEQGAQVDTDDDGYAHAEEDDSG